MTLWNSIFCFLIFFNNDVDYSMYDDNIQMPLYLVLATKYNYNPIQKNIDTLRNDKCLAREIGIDLGNYVRDEYQISKFNKIRIQTIQSLWK